MIGRLLEGYLYRALTAGSIGSMGSICSIGSVAKCVKRAGVSDVHAERNVVELG